MPDVEPGLVSVVIPTRNRVALLSEAIASAQAQDWPALEIIVIDDASTDRTPAALQAMVAADARLRVIRNVTPGGGSWTRNQGIAAARGRFVAFLDDDDLWVPTKVRRQVELLESTPGANAVSCHFVVSFPNGRDRRVAVRPSRDLQQIIRENHLGGASMCLTTKAALEAVGGFDPSLPSCQDWDLWIKLRVSGDVPVCETPLVVYRPHRGPRITSQLAAAYQGRRRLFRLYHSRMTAATRRSSLGELVFVRRVLMGNRLGARVSGLWQATRLSGVVGGLHFLSRLLKTLRGHAS